MLSPSRSDEEGRFGVCEELLGIIVSGITFGSPNYCGLNVGKIFCPWYLKSVDVGVRYGCS